MTITRCDECGTDLRSHEGRIETQLVTDEPRLADDTELKEFCSYLCLLSYASCKTGKKEL